MLSTNERKVIVTWKFVTNKTNYTNACKHECKNALKHLWRYLKMCRIREAFIGILGHRDFCKHGVWMAVNMLF